MALRVRRVVTGHDAEGKAIIAVDEEVISGPQRRLGHSACVIWTNERVPADNSDRSATMRSPAPKVPPEGTMFAVTEFAPGVARRVHRTESLDHVVVLSGEIDMEFERSEVHLKAGDVLVLRGTTHNWVNRGAAPCRIAAVLVPAPPFSIGGKDIKAEG